MLVGQGHGEKWRGFKELRGLNQTRVQIPKADPDREKD